METIQSVIKGGEWIIKEVNAKDIFIPEEFNEEQLMVRDMCNQFIDTEVLPVVERIDKLEPGLMPSLLEKAGAQGLLGITIPEAYGGSGKDFVTSVIVAEYLGGGYSFSVANAAHAGIGTLPILYFGTEVQKQKYVTKLATGEFKGSYGLTEPNAGSDALSAKTTATLSADGKHYILNGQKCWITNGGFADIYTVFAKIDGEHFTAFIIERGTEGFTQGPEEHKMGIKGSATCVLNFDDATGYMIGLKNKGLNAMFTMMNLERIVVGIQGLGNSEIAYQNSLSYAKERKQGKTNNTKSTNGADFIIEHADIRKSLLNMKSIIEGERALCFWLSQQTEVSLYHPDEKIKQEASDLVSLMTPVVKTMFSDMGMEITSEAMQVHGGYGYTKDQGIEQLYRDNRITPIYEGTNSIQAADLVFRKLVNKNGDIIDKYLELIKNDCSTENEKLKPFIKELKTHLEILSTFTDWIKEKVQNSKDDASAACNDYLKALGFVSIAHAWIKVLEVSFKDYEQNKDFYEDKIQTANFYFKRVLPRAESHFKTATSGSDYIMNFKFS